MAINKCFVSGNLTADPTLRATQGGTAILDFGIAVNERRKNNQTGQYEDRPNFFSCKIFGNRAEALSRILAKGMHVSIEGRLQWSSWEDKNTGQKRSKVEIIVDEVVLMSQRQGGAPQGAPAPQYGVRQQQVYTNPPQPQMAPQMPSQAPMAPAPQYGNYQPTQQPPVPQQQMDVYDEDIPF